MGLRDYYCRTNNGGAVRVQFHRVTDFVANAALTGNLPNGLSAIFGKPKLIKNSVHTEFNTLMNRFGHYQQYVDCEEFKVISAGKGRGMEGKNGCNGNSTKGLIRRSLGGWYQVLDGVVFPATNDLRMLETNGKIPRGYKTKNMLRWGVEPYKAIWRYTKRKDFKNHKKQLRDYNKLVAALKKNRETTIENKYFAMLDYITSKGVPRKFMVLYGGSEPSADCQGFPSRWVINYTERAMLVDLALIENTSSKAITIKQLLGASSRKTSLRSMSKSTALRKMNSTSLSLGSLRLTPGQKAMLFQRMAYIVPKEKKAGFQLPGYVYGPETLLKGLEINGERLDLEGQSSNFISLTAGDEGGSCPFLHIWSKELKDWVNTGKMLDKSKSAALEQTDTRQFEGFVGKFRIHEEEPELAFIDKAMLMVELKNGQHLSLKPDNHKLANRDRLRLKLGYGEYVELAFTLPDGIEEQQVTSSTISLTGYYERYSALQHMSRLNRPLELLVKVSD